MARLTEEFCVKFHEFEGRRIREIAKAIRRSPVAVIRAATIAMLLTRSDSILDLVHRFDSTLGDKQD